MSPCVMGFLPARVVIGPLRVLTMQSQAVKPAASRRGAVPHAPTEPMAVDVVGNLAEENTFLAQDAVRLANEGGYR